MSQRYNYWPQRKGDQLIWLYNCLAVWPSLGPALGFTPAQVTAFTLVLTQMIAMINETDQCQIAMKAINDWREQVFYGAMDGKEAPPPPSITTPSTPTANNGYFDQLKQVRLQALASPDYTTAIGEALGFVGPEKQPLNPALAEPDFKVVASSDYWVNFKGSLQGFDAVKVDYQRKGTANWENIGFLTRTPGGLQITPTVPGTAETGVVRCAFVEDNETVGQYSPNYPVTIS